MFKKWLERNKNALKCKPKSMKKSFEEFFEEDFKGEKAPLFKKGEIYFAKLNKSAKIRPFLIYQNDYLNKACYEGEYNNVIVIPLSGQILGGDYRVFIKKRDLMTKDSEIVCTALGIISVSKIVFSKGLITTLTSDEIEKVDKVVKEVLDIKV